MESIGDAAQRLLAKLEARIAEKKASRTPQGPGEIQADGFSIMVLKAKAGVSCHDIERPDRPHHREDDMGEERAEALPVRMRCRSRGGVPGASARLGEVRLYPRLASPLRLAAANDDRRVHTEARACSAISATSIDLWQM